MRVTAPDGVEYEITVEPAPKVKLGAWLHGPWRWWSTITRDTSWWVTVQSSAAGWPVLRERYADGQEAARRVDALDRAIRDGQWTPGNFPPILRRRG